VQSLNTIIKHFNDVYAQHKGATATGSEPETGENPKDSHVYNSPEQFSSHSRREYSPVETHRSRLTRHAVRYATCNNGCLTACRIVQAYSFLPGYNPYRDCLPVVITCLFFIPERC
jgi:hypothetical protein